MFKGRKVAIVGMSGTFPTVSSIEEFRTKLFKGESLIREWPDALAFGGAIRSTVSGYITDKESNIETVYSSLIPDFPETYVDLSQRIPAVNLATADMGSVWAMHGSLDVISEAGWTKEEVESERTGVIIGSGSGGNVVARPAWQSFFQLKKKTRYAGSHTVDRVMVYREAANVSCLIRNKGVCEAIGSACATGLGNIGYAYRLIKFGIQDRIITGGLEGTALESFIGFDAMQVLSKGFSPEKSSRPFSKTRNGFVCSFGSGIFALEEYEMAKSRGAKILAVIDGYANNSDGDGNMFYPSFDGQKRLWNTLAKETYLKPEVVKAHGTATPIGDSVELFSIVDFMGAKGYHISAPKSQFGHMLGGAGSVELISAVMMLQEQKVLPCLNSEDLNDKLETFQLDENWEGSTQSCASFRDLIPTSPVEKEINQIVCLNYGFGGTNSAMAISLDN